MAGTGAEGAAVGEAVEVEVPPVPCFLPPGMTTGSAAAGGAVVVGAAVGPAVVGAVAVGAEEDKEVPSPGGTGTAKAPTPSSPAAADDPSGAEALASGEDANDAEDDADAADDADDDAASTGHS